MRHSRRRKRIENRHKCGCLGGNKVWGCVGGIKKIACAAEISGAIDNPSTSLPLLLSLLSGWLPVRCCLCCVKQWSSTHRYTQRHNKGGPCSRIQTHTHTRLESSNQPSPLSYITQCYGYQQLLLLLPHGTAVAAACCMLLLLLPLLLQRQTLESANNARWR